DDEVRQWSKNVLLVGSGKPRIVAILRVRRSVVAASKCCPIVPTQRAVELVVDDLSCHPEQLFAFGNGHCSDHCLDICISCNLGVKSHELTYAPRCTMQSSSTVQRKRTLETLILGGTTSAISACLGVANVRMRRIKCMVSLTAEDVALKQNHWSSVGQ